MGGCQRHNKGWRRPRTWETLEWGDFTEVGFIRKLDLTLPTCQYRVQRVAMAIARHSLVKGCVEYSLLRDIRIHEPVAERTRPVRHVRMRRPHHQHQPTIRTHDRRA